MSHALARTLAPAAEEVESRLNVVVIFTSVKATMEALKRAGELADRLDAHIQLIVPQIVPYPLPLSTTPALQEWNARRFRVLAKARALETSVQIYLCRDGLEALKTVLSPRSLIVIGTRKRWWPTAEKRLARVLRRAGHEVILAEMD